MNFFQSQDDARRKTTSLVFLYFLAVVGIIISVYFAYLGIFLIATSKNPNQLFEYSNLSWWQPKTFFWVCGITGFVVLTGTIYKIISLSQGGEVVARSLGGREVVPSTNDLLERRLLNIVEEMAIASGIAVPTVFLLDREDSINAFAAGFNPSDAVIGVTRGCLEKLSRDELQGVIAHEFSHVLNGDMRLNIRLIGVLHGILIIGMIGYWILRSRSYSTSSRKDSKGGGLMLFALALTIIGAIGTFFGKLIKSAVSRQREFLADASAVQFTRNPEGIAGALKKIGGFSKGGLVKSPSAEEVSHMFFAKGIGGLFSSLFATHPPLALRIKKLDPGFTGEFIDVVYEPQRVDDASSSLSSFSSQSSNLGGALESEVKVKASNLINKAGHLEQKNIELSKNLIASIPKKIRDSIREQVGAQAVLFSLLMHLPGESYQKQILYLKKAVSVEIFKELDSLIHIVRDLDRRFYLPLVDLLMPSLRNMSISSYENFREAISYLIKADSQVDLFEYAIIRIVKRNLDPIYYGKRASEEILYKDPLDIVSTLSELLSSMAYFGHNSYEAATEAYRAAISSILPNSNAILPKLNDISISKLDRILAELNKSTFSLKEKILQACAACVSHDGILDLREIEMLRAISDALDCPIPLEVF